MGYFQRHQTISKKPNTKPPPEREEITQTNKKGTNMDFLQPPGWVRPRGYSNGIATHGRTVCVSGMIGWDATGAIPHR